MEGRIEHSGVVFEAGGGASVRATSSLSRVGVQIGKVDRSARRRRSTSTFYTPLSLAKPHGDLSISRIS